MSKKAFKTWPIQRAPHYRTVRTAPAHRRRPRLVRMAAAGVALPAALNRGTALAAATPMQPFSPMHGLEPNKGLSTPKKRLSLLLSTKGMVARGGGGAPRRPTIVPHHQYGLLRKVGLKKPIILFLRPLYAIFSLILFDSYCLFFHFVLQDQCSYVLQISNFYHNFQFAEKKTQICYIPKKAKKYFMLNIFQHFQNL